MSIRCVCENGHELKVKDSFAGSSGLCPVCRGRVVVPQPAAAAMSEDTIMTILGKHSPSAGTTSDRFDPSDPGSQSGIGLKKTCERCNKEISSGSHICPYCRTYIANLRDF
jgi:hypothetical protein